MMAKVFLALIHYPVYNRNYEVISTSITNLDIHDIARVATTYGLERYFLVHPLATQRELAQRVVDYWITGAGAAYNQDRQEAFQCLRVLSSLAEVQTSIEQEYGRKPVLIATDARSCAQAVGYAELRKQIQESEENYLLLFGTGWGLDEQIMQQTDLILAPILGPQTYNHLSVRSAVAIIVDRLFGKHG